MRLAPASENPRERASDKPERPRTAAAGRATCPDGPRVPTPVDDPPSRLLRLLEQEASHPEFTRRRSSISIWIEGYGEVLAHNAEQELVPASNQKLLTAAGALILLPPSGRLTTRVAYTGRIDDTGTLHGDLYLIGGGDPTLMRTGEHSLEELASRVARAGLRRVKGRLLGDESRYDDTRKASGWLYWQQPVPGGVLSALMVNGNQRIGTREYLTDPTVHNTRLFLEALERAGVEVEGEATEGVAPDSAEDLIGLDSPTFAEMVRTMLKQSDNMIAEMLVKEIGLRSRGAGSTVEGLRAIREAVERDLCLAPLGGADDDGSGISRSDRRSARRWRELLQLAGTRPWGRTLYEGLPVAADEDGTLKRRFHDTPAAGNVRAKTGSTGVAQALSGTGRTAQGRRFWFSILVNGDQPKSAAPAIDRLVAAVAGWRE